MKQEYKWYADAENIAEDDLQKLGKTIIIAPHQDDESLGCGGTIALLTNAGIAVHVLFVTDGSKSHPNSKIFPAEKLITLREKEALDALLILGVERTDITFLRLPDGALPAIGDPGFEQAVHSLTKIFDHVKPEAVFMPWQRDPHRDHRAAWQMTEQVIKNQNLSVRKLEYLIWLWERADSADLPQPGETKVWQVDIQKVAYRKKLAIAAHISQTTNLINDDPDGFILSPEVLAHFDKTTELFVERLQQNLMKKPDTSLPENYFNDVYSASSDPWNFETSDYETAKYTATVNALTKPEYDNAFEIGCSIGVLTEMLAGRCKNLLSVDVTEAPLAKARERLSKQTHVTFQKMAVPVQFPSSGFDLIVMSEVGYYLACPDFRLLQEKLIGQLITGGQLLLVHWTPVVDDYPLTGDEVHDAFMGISGEDKPFRHLLNRREATYRLDLFEKQ